MKKLIGYALTIILGTNLFAQDGSLDLTFGNSGIVLTDYGSTFSTGFKIATQADGKILIGGGRSTSPGSDFVLGRYLADGTLDSTFADNGLVSTFLTTDVDNLSGLQTQSDGKILVGGTAGFYYIDQRIALVRYLSDGSLDSSFANNGILLDSFPGTSTFCNAFSIQNDGKIIVAGSQNASTVWSCLLIRYNIDGSKDTTFGVNGVVLNNFSSTYNKSFSELKLQSDGKIVAVGSIKVINGLDNLDYLIARFNPDGSIDSTFHNDGVRSEALLGNEDEAMATVEIQNDGKILTSINHIGNATLGYDIMLMRFNLDGSYDTSFDTDGLLITDLASGFLNGQVNDILLQDDGKMVVVGFQRISANIENFALLRYHPNGVLDNTFGTNGITLTDFDSLRGCTAYSACFQSDGKILAIGTLYNGVFWSKAAFSRYHNLGSNIGIEELALASFKISPNPFLEQATIQLPIDITDGKIQIVSLNGQILHEINNCNGNNFLLNRNQLSSGVYFIHISSAKFSGNERIVVQ